MSDGLESFSDQSQGVETVAALPPVPETPIEKMLPQSKVNELVGHARIEGYSKSQRDYETRQQKAVEQQQQTSNNSMGGMQQISDKDIEERIARAAKNHVDSVIKQATDAEQTKQAEQVVNSFLTKMQKGIEQYPDFDQKVGSIGLETIPNVIRMATQFDNAHEIMYELANNPLKADELERADPRRALLAMQKLSDSINENQTALGQRKPSPPLSRVSSSITATDNGTLTVKDFKAMSWAKA